MKDRRKIYPKRQKTIFLKNGQFWGLLIQYLKEIFLRTPIDLYSAWLEQDNISQLKPILKVQ